MAVPESIIELVERFERNIQSYKESRYNETQVRREFVDPFFAALGWDVDNTQGYAEAYKDVIHEDAIKVGSATKAPDYCFRIGGTRKFFLEAKKPSIDVKGDPGPAYQLRRYAWSAKLPLSILTDFEEFAVYDCRVRPAPTDKSSTARVLYLTYRDYIEKWDEIASIFSRDAVLKGSFDKYAETSRLKKGTAEVDASFLAEIETWREALAKNIALRNPTLNHRELNFAVQLTIDRIIFLRICEDRGIERYGELMSLLNGEKIYDRLLGLFQRADDRYNSGLFHFSQEKDRHDPPDELTPNLVIDDKVLKDIFKPLYYPDCPFEFSVLPAEILGQVYEQFLGSTITLTAGHRAKVENKPEVKKAGGVFYTPSYIVDYIVQNTVGKLVEGKTPKQIQNIRVLDPACGSGSFLLGAYRFLLDWYLQYYLENEPKEWAKKKNPPICATTTQNPLPPSEYSPLAGGELKSYKLTLAERKRILLAHIYGVDIDSQAVEVTKLSLLLKVLEGERQLVLIHTERALPDLCDNIKCGNSLIGSDFYQGQQMALFDDEMHYKINAFDWDKEFPEIFKGKTGGFDAVIGNPPYLGGREWKEKYGRQYNYFVETFNVAEYQFDIYVLFWEKGISLLNKNGVIGFITPNTWLNNQGCKKLREFILENTKIQSIADYSRVKVFSKAVVLPIITILHCGNKSLSDVEVYLPEDSQGALRLCHKISQNIWAKDESKIFNIALTVKDMQVRAKIEKNREPLVSVAEVKFGIKLYETGKGNPPQKASDAENHVFEADHKIGLKYRRYLQGKDVNRYQVLWQNRWLEYGCNLAAPRDPKLFEEPRLLIRRIVGERLLGTYVDADYVTSQLLQIVKPYDKRLTKYILGVLNSSLIAYYFRKKYNRQDKTFPEIRIYELESLPIPILNLDSSSGNTICKKMTDIVDYMLGLHEKLSAAKTADAKTRLQRQIDATDDQIDRLVYELYGLTEEEIKIVEGTGER